MKGKLFQNKIYVKKSSTHGFGVFAGKNFRKGEKIEECYILISRGGDKTLDDFYFEVNSKKGKYGLFTGFGSIYNHSEEPNADYFINANKHIVTIKADTAIHKGDEIFLSYGDEWFKSRGRKPKQPSYK